MNTDSNNLSNSASKDDNDEIDLMALLFVLLRGWKVVLFFALLGLVIGVLYSRLLSPVFESQALIEVRENQPQGLSGLNVGNITDLISPGSSSIQKEADLINSRMILGPVVDSLHLDIRLDDPAIDFFDKIKSNSVNTQVSISEGVALKTADGRVQVSQFNVAQPYLEQPFTLIRSTEGNDFILSNGFDDFKGQLGQEHRFSGLKGVIEITVNDLPTNEHMINITKQQTFTAIDAIIEALVVEESGKQTGIMDLSLTGTNQQQVTLILKQIIQSYINNKKITESQETINTLAFMETQLPNLKQKLENSEAAFNKFRQEYGTIDIGQEAALLVAEKSQIDSQLNELKLKKADLATYYTEEHPLIVQINEQFGILNSRKQEIGSKVLSLPNMQREFLKLSEDTSINRELYLNMLKSYEQLRIVKAGQVSDVRIIDLPISTYKAIAPKKQLIIIIASIIGIMLGTLTVLLRSFFRNVIKDPKRLGKVTGIPVIAVIPQLPLFTRSGKTKRLSNPLLFHIDKSSLSYEAIKSLRTYLMFSAPSKQKLGERAEVVAISAEGSNVGKSFISANLAEVFAQLDKKILIIDADMRQGNLHTVFNIEHNIGLADYLLQKNSDSEVDIVISDFIHPSSISNLDFMPKGQDIYNSTSLLAMDKFKLLMLRLNKYYDYIFIDSPHMPLYSDAIIISQYADKVLIVTRSEYSLEEEVIHTIDEFNKANVNVDGIILNNIKKVL